MLEYKIFFDNRKFMKFSLDKFNENGVSWPFTINNLSGQDLEKKYFKFQEKAKSVFKKDISLKPNLISKFFDSLCFEEEILTNVKKIIGNDVYIWSSAIFSKPPGTGKIVSFHQDNPYWQLTTDKVITVWIAITNSDKNSGALEVVPGSSKLGIIKNLDVPNARNAYVKGLKTTSENDMLSYKQDLKEFLKDNNPETINLKPAQYSIHHVNTVHGSGINESQNFRIGFAVRYISSDTRHHELENDYAVHVCGKKNSYFIEEKRPTEDFGSEEISNYEISMKSGGAFGNKKY